MSGVDAFPMMEEPAAKEGPEGQTPEAAGAYSNISKVYPMAYRNGPNAVSNLIGNRDNLNSGVGNLPTKPNFGEAYNE